jgi:hypothetical protein
MAAACSPRIATLAAAAADPVDADGLRQATFRRAAAGTSCRWFVLGIPLGLPRIDEAVAGATAGGGGTFMRNVGVWSVHRFYGLAGRHCYTVRGEVFG